MACRASAADSNRSLISRSNTVLLAAHGGEDLLAFAIDHHADRLASLDLLQQLDRTGGARHIGAADARDYVAFLHPRARRRAARAHFRDQRAADARRQLEPPRQRRRQVVEREAEVLRE